MVDLNKNTKQILSSRKLELYQKNAEIIKFWRRNPIIAARDLLGIRLMDSQKWILQESWNKPYTLWCCSRNFGKSFLGSILMVLKWMLYENQSIYIISSVGSQAQETFTKIEKMAFQRIESIKSLKDIFANETVKSPSNKTGFTHNPSSFRVSSYNGSDIFTLNGKPDNNRSKRASLVFFDEAGFSSEELLTAAIAFATQDTNFTTSTDEDFSMAIQRKKCPTQLIFASSASDDDTTFYRKYKEYSKRMFMGDNRYFVADIPCDIPLEPMMDGEKHPPLLKKQQVEDELQTNPEKAKREYFNKFVTDGGESQIIKRNQVIRNSTLLLPELVNKNNKNKFIMAVDPARTNDNSICSVMKIKYDKRIGYYGEIVNCISFLDIGKKKRMQMKTPDQIKYFRNLLLDYNGDVPDYENIEQILIDAGAGGSGISSWGDGLLESWVDEKGIRHKGLIDTENDIYKEYVSSYPDAVDKIKLVSPQKYKKQIVDELIELIRLDLIKFPKEYNGKGFVTLAEDKENKREIKQHSLSMEEEIALINIDIMKSESTSIHKFKSSNGNVRYDLPKEKENKIHDDRFYTLALLAHYLYKLRRKDKIGSDYQYEPDEDLVMF